MKGVSTLGSLHLLNTEGVGREGFVYKRPNNFNVETTFWNHVYSSQY